MNQIDLRAICVIAIFIVLPESAPTLVAQQSDHPNPVVIENRLPGARDWQLTRVRLDAGGFRSPWIEGYCSRQSVKAGEQIDIMVSTNPVRKFSVEFFRMGYYQGRGARLMKTVESVPGAIQPDPEIGDKNLRECRWRPSLSLTIPEDWLSGVYLGRLTTIPEGSESYWQSYIVFIVTDDRPADVLFSVQTTRGRHTIDGRITFPSTLTPKEIRGRGRMSALIVPTEEKPSLRAL
ncbi:MAG: DUF6605 domain-containing protein [Planctomycetaceae bacterium]